MRKKIISAVVTLMIAAVFISGCGRSRKGKGDSTAEVVNYYTNDEIDFEIENKMDANVSNVKYIDGYIYYERFDYPEYPQSYYDAIERLKGEPDAGSDKISDEELYADDEPVKEDDSKIGTYKELFRKYRDYKPTCGMYRYDPATKTRTNLFNFDIESYKMEDYCYKKNGNLLVFHQVTDFDSVTLVSNYGYTLDEFDKSGKKVSCIDLGKAVDDPLANRVSGNDTIEGVRVYDEDNILYQRGNELIVIDSAGKRKGSVEPDSYLDYFARDSEGNVVMSCNNDDKSSFIKADMKQYKSGDKIEGIPEGTYKSLYELYDGGFGHSFILKDINSLYSYDYATGSMTEMLKFFESGVIGETVTDIELIDENRIFYSCTSQSDGSVVAGILTRSDEDIYKDKTVITVMMGTSDSEIQEKIIEYNKLDKPYKIELMSFDNDEDSATSINNQLIAGNIPDIIDISSVNLNNYISKDLLEDLTPYIEEDENVNEDYFIDGYLDATRIDDKLYFLARNFTIKTLVGKKSLFEKYKDGWTIQDIIEYYKKMPGGTKLFYSDDKESLFFYLLYENLDSFIDWDTGEVHFDSEEFRNALQFCNEFETLRENTDYDMSNANEDFKVNRVLLHKEEVNGSAEIQVLRKMFSNDYMFVGFPRKEGRGIYVKIDHAFGICTESEDKDGAWDVLKTLIANHKKSLMQVIMMRSIPSSKEEFEEMVRRDTATENYIDVYGNDVHPRDASYGFDDYELKITPSTKDEIDKLKELIKMADGINGLTETSSKMVLEDVRPYFDGKRTLDDAIRIIQDRMSKFVNESR